MIKLYNEKNNTIEDLTIEDLDNLKKDTWVHLSAPTPEIIQKICDVTKLDKQRLMGALDPEETAHIDFDGDNLITIDIPVWRDDVCETIPFVMMYNMNYFVSLCNEETSLIESVIQKTKKIDVRKRNRFSMQIMYRITAMYISALRKIDTKRGILEERIKTSTKNKEIFELMDVNKSLIYISTSLNSNKNAFLKLERISEFKKYEEDNDLMEDVIIENNQAIEMCSIHRAILDSMLNAFASITSNNLNIIMKLLAIITLVISLPTLVSSIYGMNVKGLPFAEKTGAFWIIMAFSIVFAATGAVILIKTTSYSIQQRKNKKK